MHTYFSGVGASSSTSMPDDEKNEIVEKQPTDGERIKIVEQQPTDNEIVEQPTDDEITFIDSVDSPGCSSRFCWPNS